MQCSLLVLYHNALRCLQKGCSCLFVSCVLSRQEFVIISTDSQATSECFLILTVFYIASDIAAQFM